jgi:hypothetical protein
MGMTMRVLAGWKSIIKGVAKESKRERGQCDCVGVALFTGVFGLIGHGALFLRLIYLR